MRRSIVRHLRSNVVAYLALFIALGGTSAYAANTVFSSDIVDGQVMTPDLADSGVTSAKIVDGGVHWADLSTNSVTSSRVTDATLKGVDLADDTVTGAQIDESSLGTVPAATSAQQLGGLGLNWWQRRVGGTCGAGSGIGLIDAVGAVTCNDDALRPGGGGYTLGGIALGAQHCAKLEIPLGGMAVGDTAIMVPDAAAWPTGMMLQMLRSDQANNVAIQACNPTAASVSAPATTISIWRIKLNP